MTNALMFLAILLNAQVDDIEPGRTKGALYVKPMDECARAEELIATDPSQAITLLDWVIKQNLEKVECLLRVKRKDNEYYPKTSEPKARFFPYEFRGSAYLKRAATRQGAPARADLLQALKDLRLSWKDKRNPRSKAPWEKAKAAMSAQLRTAFRFDDWDEQDLRLFSQAAAFLEGHPKEAEAAAAWIEKEIGKVGALITELREGTPADQPTKIRARRVVAWCRAVRNAMGSVETTKRAVDSVKPVLEGAEWIVAYRGAFRLSISVYPYARVEKIVVGGKEVPLGKQVFTPVRVPAELEVDDLLVVLVNPDLKSRKEVSVRLDDGVLARDGTYLISGTMEGKTPLSFKPLRE